METAVETMKKTVEDPEIVQRLRTAFRATGKQQIEIAADLGVSRSYVGNLMAGSAPLSGMIARGMLEQGYDVVYILTGKSEKNRIKELEVKVETLKELLREWSQESK